MFFIDCPWKEIYITGARKSATVSLLPFPLLPHPLFLKYIHSVPWYRQVSKSHPPRTWDIWWSYTENDGWEQSQICWKLRGLDLDIKHPFNVGDSGCLLEAEYWQWTCAAFSRTPTFLLIPVMSLGDVMTSSSRSHKICSQVCRQQVHFLPCTHCTTKPMHSSLSSPRPETAALSPKGLITQAWDSRPLTHKSPLLQQIIALTWFTNLFSYLCNKV